MTKTFKRKSVRKYISASTNNYKGDVILTYRDEKLKKRTEVIEGYATSHWYFLITRKDYEKLIEIGIAEELEKDGMGFLDNPVAFEIDETGKWVKCFVTNKGISEKYSKGRTDDRLKLKQIFDEDGIKIFEGDLKPHKRYCIDNNIPIADNFQIGYYDIETDDRNPGVVTGRDMITSIALWNQVGEHFFWSIKEYEMDEREMLIDFYEFVRWQIDILVGWNSDKFDKLYIEQRLIKHFLEDEANHFKWRIAHIDLMQVFIKRFSNDTKITSWKLEFIANYFLGEGKVEGVQGGNGRLWDLFINDYEKFKDYNIKDAKLLYDLNTTVGTIDQMILECQITGAFPDKYSTSELLDTYILRSVRGQGIHFPSIEYAEHQIRCPNCNHVHTSDYSYEAQGFMACIRCKEQFDASKKNEDIIGAYVVDPITGVHDDVFTFDYKSLYPTIIITWNIGPDSLVEGRELEEVMNATGNDELIKSANGQYFWKETPSAITSAIKKLLDLRVKFKKEMLDSVPDSREYDVANAKQRATKVLCNSMYGIMGYTRGRFYRREIAEAITLGGQWLNKATKKWFEEKNYEVIYGDTDSVFVKMPPDHEKFIPALLEELHSFYDVQLKKEFNIDNHRIELEYEKHFRRLILQAKKRYAGHIVHQDGKDVDKLLIKGLEYIKRDTIEYGRRLQKEVIDTLLDTDKGIDHFIAWVEKEQSKFFNEKFEIADLIITKKLTKRPESYKVKSVHVKVAEELRRRELEYYVGMRVPYIVTHDKPLEAVHPSWYEPGMASSLYYWDKQIYSICQRILEAVFKDYDWTQYTTKVIEKRKKKAEMYKKWLSDPKRQTEKRKSTTNKKISECVIISQEQKNELLGKKATKKFKIKKLDISKGKENTHDKETSSKEKNIELIKPKLKLKTKRVLKVAQRKH